MRQTKILVLFLLAYVLTGCATSPRTHVKQTSNLQELCAQNKIECTYEATTKLVSLRQGTVSANVLVGSNVVYFKDEKVLLDKSIRLRKDVITVPPDFALKVLSRFKPKEIVKVKPTTEVKVRKIIIDAGHGGKDPGASSRSGLKEKKVVLEIAKDVKSLLERQGVQVTLTRSSDVFVELNERACIANRAQADLFVSIHANSSPSRNVSGLEVYSLKDLTSLDRSGDDHISGQEALFGQLKIKNDRYVKKIVEDMLYDYKQGESKVLAGKVCDKMCQLANYRDHRVKTANFHVLRNTMMPAILVEVGYLTNPKEERLLNKSEYRMTVAEGIAKGILEYVRTQ
jgi:N-acetylmuramoyl-L-alanine amidase